MADLHIRGDGTARWAHRVLRCATGRGGIGKKRMEGDGVTPVGRFALVHVFWRADRITTVPTGMPASVIRPADGWCDAPANEHYNRLIRMPFPESHEQMWRGDNRYDLCAVIDWNIRPIKPGVGSAIFLHCAAPDYRPTEGCVALARDDLARVLADWRDDSRLVVTAP